MPEHHDKDDDNTSSSHSRSSSLFQENKQQSSFCLKILLSSLEIFPRNKQICFSIYTLGTLPLSFLLFSLSLSSHPLISHIYDLESLAQFSSTRFEARHVWMESREDAISLVRLRLLYFFPSYFLSIIAAITTVSSTYSSLNGKRFDLRAAVTAVVLAWKRTLVTTVCIYAVLTLYSLVVFLFVITINGIPCGGFFVRLIGWGFEIYLMAVLGVGLVVSIMEERLGVDAIRVGSELMEGRRVFGWVLSGLFVLISVLIGWRWERLMMMMDGRDFRKEKWTVIMESWEKIGLICLYGIEIFWGYVVTTVFYCECKKRQVIKMENDNELVTV